MTKKWVLLPLHWSNSTALTPIQQITKTVGRLTKVSDLLDATDLKNVLQGVMSSLSNENLYAPSAQMLDQLEIDDMTKKYILQSFTDATHVLNPQTPRVKVAHTILIS